jgi:hypothetical protein
MIKVDPKNPSGIVWIASYPKSGNTWVRVFLNNLMSILSSQPLTENDLAETAKNASSEAGLVPLFQQLLKKPVATATVEEVMAVRPRLHQLIKERNQSVALLKTHNILGLISGAPLINMGASAGAIYIVRNPLDVVLSLQDHLGATLPEAIAALNYPNFTSPSDAYQVFEVWGSWSQNVESWTMRQAEPVLVIRYEDMIDEPVTTFTSIVRHLGQAPTAAQIKTAIERSSFKRLNEQEARVGFSEKSARGSAFFRVGRYGQWRDKLTPEQVGTIVGKHHAQMRKFGYLTPELEVYLAKATA